MQYHPEEGVTRIFAETGNGYTVNQRCRALELIVAEHNRVHDYVKTSANEKTTFDIGGRFLKIENLGRCSRLLSITQTCPCNILQYFKAAKKIIFR